ncbi:sigma factor-like helix-turn-helix DNA-binding protein [Nocardiopsis deserti]|uniref:sigma factor-like helix-turn-helix DNA-binding protein n=1 Tax=Nocardiopsis deserti TaxID=2605988 RepID=UPI00123B9A77|nr:sigma factor-like helix-turn-helix DNA-binding protein [Nocardiopsis deserti]
MTTYGVDVKRWERGWELHIDGVGVTQARRLNEVDEMARDYSVMSLGSDEDSFDVDVSHIAIDADTDAVARSAERAQREAEQAQLAAAEKMREAVRRLQGTGLTGLEIARYLGISPQRVSQISKRALTGV